MAEENLRPGSRDWDVGLDVSADSNISGYALPFSLRSGDTLHVFVAAKRPPVSISIYRLGWYGGSGARLIARHFDRPTTSQPPCEPSLQGPTICRWSSTDTFVVGPQWIPGMYVARFADSLGRPGAFPFVVRANRTSALVVVLPFATYQAYNNWGGASLYAGRDSTGRESYANRAVKVSFARPLTDVVTRGPVFGVDYLLIRWLEQNGYDVTYITDYDFHLGRSDDPDVAWLFAGHSEYWSWPMWLRANAARARGISLGFLGGNDIYWVIRYESVSANGLDVPVVVCYRDASRDPQGATPGLATVLFRSPPNNTPENTLVGVMTPTGIPVRNPPVDLVVANGSDPLMAGTGLATGQHVPRVAGWEGDRIADNGATPPGIRILFDSPYVPSGDSVASGRLQATVYTWTASGAVVYASGEPGFAWGLSTYHEYLARPPIQKFLENVLAAFVAARSGS
jgi:N,N-dimethylformamidase beta subunit-like protein